MNTLSKWLISCIFITQLCSDFACAANPKIEADRCERWLAAFAKGDLAQAANITTEYLKPDDVSRIYIDAQIVAYNKVFETVSKIGAGKPRSISSLDSVTVSETGDIVERQIWRFPNSAQAYVGCVSYPGVDSPWHIVVKFDDSLDVLTKNLEGAAKSHASSP